MFSQLELKKQNKRMQRLQTGAFLTAATLLLQTSFSFVNSALAADSLPTANTSAPTASASAPAANTSAPTPSASAPAANSSSSPPATGASTLAAKENGVQELTLANGLKVILLEDRSFPVVTTMVFYRVGSRNEPLGETGLSHMVEHLLFDKVGRFRKGEIAATIARNGGMFNGFTSDDFTVFFETINPTKLSMALEIESERMHSASFGPDDVRGEIKRIEKELDQEAKDPVVLLNKEVRSAAFQLHPYKNPTIGWRSDVQKLTYEDARHHYKEYYHPGNATLVIVGDFSTKAAVAQVEKYFARLPRSQSAKTVRVVEPQQRAERRVYTKYGGNTDAVSMAYHSCGFLDADAAPLAVLEKLLFSGIGGRLKTRLIDTKIANSARCTFEVKHDPGLFTVNLNSTPGTSAQKVIESFESVIEQLKNAPVGEAELKRARNHAEFYVMSERDGPYRTAFHLGYAESVDNWRAAFGWFAKVRAVSSADIQRVAKRYFVSENRVLGVLSGAANKPIVKKEPDKKDGDKKDADKKDGDKKDSDAKKTDGKKSDAKAESKKPDAKKPDAKKTDGKKPDSKDSKGKEPSKGKQGGRRHTAMMPFDLPGCAYKVGDETVPELTPSTARPATSASPVAKVAQENVTANTHIKKAVLKNGMTVAVLETKLSPAVQIVGAVKAGEAYEPVGKRGASAVLAQLIADGSGRYSKQQAVTLQDELGIAPQSMIRFDAGPQWIHFQTRCLSRDVNTQLGILSSQLREPQSKDSDVEHAKQIVTEKIKHTEDTVKARVKRALMQSLIAPNTSFYPLEPMDKAHFVASLKASDVREFHAHAVRPDATTLVFVGDLTLAQAIDYAERAFEPWSGASTAKKVLVQANPRRMLKSSMTIDKRQDTMVTIGRLVDSGLGRPDYPLLLLSDCALTSHPIFSRFAQKINGELGLSSSLSLEDLASDTESYPGTTVWFLDMPLVSNLMPVAVRTVQSELKKFGKTGLTPEEFAEVRLYLNGALPVRWMANSQLAAHSVLESVVLDGACDPLPAIQKGLRASSLDLVNRFVRTTFKPDRATVVIAGTKEAIGQIHGLRQDEANGSESGAPPTVNR
jgi:predicted Zn-dependent peptidase